MNPPDLNSAPGRSTPGAHNRHLSSQAAARWLQVVLTVIGTSGIVLSFVSFAFDYVPIRDFFPGDFLEPSWWSVLPCMLLPLPIAIGYGVWLRRGLLPRWYSLSAYALAGLSIAPFLAGIVVDFSLDGIDVITYAGPFLAAFCAAAALLVWGVDRDPRESLIAMQAVYIVQIQFWLVLATGSFQAGAWLGIATSVAYLSQIMLVTHRRASWLLLFVPAILFTGIILAET